MINIENTYISYEELVNKIGEEIIQNRLMQLDQEMKEFLNVNNLNDIAYVNQMALSHAVMDYFSDIQRLKEYQKIEHVNEKFLLTRLTSYMLQDDINMPILSEKKKAFKNYLDTLYYYLKFRRCDAQSIELMLLAFKAGRLIGKEK